MNNGTFLALFRMALNMHKKEYGNMNVALAAVEDFKRTSYIIDHLQCIFVEIF